MSIVNENFKIRRTWISSRCASAASQLAGNGKGALAKRNTGSARLSIRSNTGSATPVTAPQPGIYVTKMGDGASQET
jgi:hypothetical protein